MLGLCCLKSILEEEMNVNKEGEIVIFVKSHKISLKTMLFIF